MNRDLGKEILAHTQNNGCYKNEIYTYINYKSNIDKCVTFIVFVYFPWCWWFFYYNNICDVIVNGVNQLKELLVFQIFGHVDLKNTFGEHVVSYISVCYI